MSKMCGYGSARYAKKINFITFSGIIHFSNIKLGDKKKNRQYY